MKVPKWMYFMNLCVQENVGFVLRVDCMARFKTSYGDLCSDTVPSIPCQVGEPGLSPADSFEHPASTLPTRFPAALGIGHPACGLANACALVYVAA